MNPKLMSGPCWSTASFGDTTDTSPSDLTTLGDHLHVCQGMSGRLFALRCGADAVGGFVAARCVTTLMVVAAVVGACWLVL
jgi:hypothetical protein